MNLVLIRWDEETSDWDQIRQKELLSVSEPARCAESATVTGFLLAVTGWKPRPPFWNMTQVKTVRPLRYRWFSGRTSDVMVVDNDTKRKSWCCWWFTSITETHEARRGGKIRPRHLTFTKQVTGQMRAGGCVCCLRQTA